MQWVVVRWLEGGGSEMGARHTSLMTKQSARGRPICSSLENWHVCSESLVTMPCVSRHKKSTYMTREQFDGALIKIQRLNKIAEILWSDRQK